MRNLLFTILICTLGFYTAFGQDRFMQIQDKLIIHASTDIPALNEKVNLSVTNVSIQEFLRGIASTSSLNINVDPDLKIQVVNNFTDVKVIDVLAFLCREYDLDISIMGNIINVFKPKVDVPPTPIPSIVTVDPATGDISLRCDGEELSKVLKEIVDKTGYNIVPAPGLDKVKVSCYIQNMNIDDALDKFAFANNLKITKTNDVYQVEKNDPAAVIASAKDKHKGKNGKGMDYLDNIKIHILDTDSISIEADEASLSDIVKAVASELKRNFVLECPLTGDATFVLNGTSFSHLLQFLFQNTPYSFQVTGGTIVIGESKTREMKEFTIIKLQNRPVDTVISIIPLDLKKDMEIRSFAELNSLLVGGVPSRIKNLEAFVRSIDKSIPVITLEVMIIDVTKSKGVNTGVTAGIGTAPAVTGGTLNPGIGTSTTGFTLSSQSINNMLNSFNGFGLIKLGNVTPNFYMNIQALQSIGLLDVRSTPKLSTLNGHTATMSVTDCEYYQEQTSNMYGTLSAQTTTLTAYKEQKAELSVKIRPVISGDDQITMEIEVNQEDFTTRLSQYAPYGKTSRKFKALIRVKNGEMILLGGLDEKRVNNNSSGTPILARIPILKWFFTTVNNATTDERLNIFIKPTILN